jgi:hypothetical protein
MRKVILFLPLIWLGLRAEKYEYNVMLDNDEVGIITVDSKEKKDVVEFQIFRQYVVGQQHYIDSTHLILDKEGVPIRAVSRKSIFFQGSVIFDNLYEIIYGNDTIFIKPSKGEEYRVPLSSKPVYDGENLWIELERFPLKKKGELKFPIFFPQTKQLVEASIKVGEEKVSIGEKEFPAYRVEVTYQKRKFTYWLRREFPHILLKLNDATTGFQYIKK